MQLSTQEAGLITTQLQAPERHANNRQTRCSTHTLQGRRDVGKTCKELRTASYKWL